MPEFLLRHKPGLRKQALAMAQAVQSEAQKHFNLEVTYEVRSFGKSAGMPHFYVTGWATDNDDVKVATVDQVHTATLLAMQLHATKNQIVDCWWQRVKGRFARAKGLMNIRPKKKKTR